MKYETYAIVVDLETGGFHPHCNPILEIAMISYDQSFNKVGEYKNFILPYKGIDDKELVVTAGALEANGIQMQEVMSKGISLQQIYRDIIKFIKSFKCSKYAKPYLVGHNLTFDIGFLEYIFELCEPFKKNPEDIGKLYKNSLYNYVDRIPMDTIQLCRIKYGLEEMENYQLHTMCKYNGVELTDAHRAMADTAATGDLFKLLINNLRGQTNQVVVREEENHRTHFQF